MVGRAFFVGTFASALLIFLFAVLFSEIAESEAIPPTAKLEFDEGEFLMVAFNDGSMTVWLPPMGAVSGHPWEPSGSHMGAVSIPARLPPTGAVGLPPMGGVAPFRGLPSTVVVGLPSVGAVGPSMGGLPPVNRSSRKW